MAAVYGIRVTIPVALDPDPAQSNYDDRLSAYKLAQLVLDAASGVLPSGSSQIVATQQETFASGTLTLSSASGTVGGIINGVTITVTASGGDTATAAAIAAAINASANPLVLGAATATSNGAGVTVTSVRGGGSGNYITLAASGTGVSASGARLTGGGAVSTVTLNF